MGTGYLCVLVLIGVTVIKETKAAENVSITTVSSLVPILSTTTRKPLFSSFRLPCSCFKGQCGCCTGYILDRLNQKACMNMTYEPEEFAVHAVMSLNGVSFYQNTFSEILEVSTEKTVTVVVDQKIEELLYCCTRIVQDHPYPNAVSTAKGKNPPPICIPLPRLRFIKFCVEFSNVYFANRNVHLCIDAEANWEDFTLLQWSFDCVRMGTSGFAIVKPADGGGVPVRPIDIVDQTDEDYDDSARNSPIIKKKGYDKETKIIFHRSLNRVKSPSPDKTLASVKKVKSGNFIVFLKDNNNER